ncbi:hypothetical protein FB567DRAFT_602646 [Paraphoma chrysanthemicola]|uniref:Uncharacterized protein n=1 Tax=Paraphoma chrysanthemicola TaxID=798071 RepID=A0A8K0VZ38_9PLEO|nr:hypothetical protein FB567DRAFT_602646 [Paraphoma chrysanthemicola]
MRRHARYTTLNDEETSYSNNHELTGLGESSILEHPPLVKPSEYDQAGGNRLQRFYTRTFVGILGPFIVCGCYVAIWCFYLTPNGSQEPLLLGPRGAKWIFYSWFVVGVIGLALSLYSLLGVEAGMLMEPAWNVGDATKLMLHADKTWSGPGGWLRTIKWSLGSRCGRRSPSCLWFVLAIPSLLVFVALPLSGLTMEITQGYRRLKDGGPVTMTGFSYDTFNKRGGSDIYQNAAMTWKSGQELRFPGAGVVYTPRGFERSQLDFLKRVPAVFPQDDGIPQIFVTAQSEQPIEGRSWGLLLQYNCSIVNEALSFQLLNPRNRRASNYSQQSNSVYDSLVNEGKTYMARLNDTELQWAMNFVTVAEVGLQIRSSFDVGKQTSSNQTNSCYFNNDETSTDDYPDIHQHQTFEMVLWQKLLETSVSQSYFNAYDMAYNFTIDHNITEFFGAYDARVVANLSKKMYENKTTSMPAVGVQCNASSSVGSAEVNGIESSYTDFQRTDTIIHNAWDKCAPRFTGNVPLFLLGIIEGDELGSTLFQTSGAPQPYYGTKDRPGTGKKQTFLAQLKYLQAEELRRSMLRAYASYAMQLMYNGGQKYTSRDGSSLTFLNPNATTFSPGSVIKSGVIPPLVPIALFCIWALFSFALGITYGFRRRWTETLDGHTMFRMGAELSESERQALLKTSNIVKKEDRIALDEIPALVGDTKPAMWLGRIGLVKDVRADKKKLYE